MRVRPRPASATAWVALALLAAIAAAAFAAGARLDLLQVSEGEFTAFLRSKNRSARQEERPPDAAAVNVTWYQARDYCRAQGKRLPSAQEWIGACRADQLAFREGIWEWTTTDAPDELGEAGFKRLCGPGRNCSCTHAYHQTWMNPVKGFRCALPEPSVRRMEDRGRP